jgi:GST-like protein
MAVRKVVIAQASAGAPVREVRQETMAGKRSPSSSTRRCRGGSRRWGGDMDAFGTRSPGPGPVGRFWPAPRGPGAAGLYRAPFATAARDCRMRDASTYQPPRIWTWNKASGGRFANINRPVAGATHEKDLPVGRHPLQLYSLATPNGVKVTVMLEELLALGHAGAEYDAWLIRINEGEQFGSGFVAVNPNSKIPALLDRSGPAPIRVFESGAILLYLAEKFGALLPTDAATRAECLSWLFWQMGSAPYLGGGFGHFYAYAPEKIEYAIDRFAMEVKRQLDVLNRRLAESPYLAGDDYTIADIAVWPWYGALAKGLLYEAGEFLQVQDYPHVQRWTDAIAQRPAVQRGRRVNRTWGRPESQLPERHDAADFDHPAPSPETAA